jgi:hypothetical protein
MAYSPFGEMSFSEEKQDVLVGGWMARQGSAQVDMADFNFEAKVSTKIAGPNVPV